VNHDTKSKLPLHGRVVAVLTPVQHTLPEELVNKFQSGVLIYKPYNEKNKLHSALGCRTFTFDGCPSWAFLEDVVGAESFFHCCEDCKLVKDKDKIVHAKGRKYCLNSLCSFRGDA